jgi:hypothetical protein
MSSDNIKTASFGGVGGAYNGSSFSPGKSPIGQGGSNPGGNQVNYALDNDKGIDWYFNALHFEPNLVDNIEKLLTPQHTDVDSEKNYVSILSPEEREREKFRSKLRAYKSSLEQEANSLRKNSPAYIREHFYNDDLRTLEQRLEDRHEYKKGQKFEFEDKIPPQEPASRYHIAITDNQIIRIAQDITNRRTEITDRYPGEVDQYSKYQLSNPSLGKTPLLLHGDELNQYFKDSLNINSPDDDGRYEDGLKDTVLTGPDPDTQLNMYSPQSISKDTPILNLDTSIEGNLNVQESYQNRFYRNNPNLKEKMGVEDVYEGSPFYGVHTNQVFK